MVVLPPGPPADARPLVAAAMVTLALACGWNGATATPWHAFSGYLSLTPGELWSLATVTLIGIAAWRAAMCFAPRRTAPAPANDNRGHPHPLFRTVMQGVPIDLR